MAIHVFGKEAAAENLPSPKLRQAACAEIEIALASISTALPFCSQAVLPNALDETLVKYAG